jgi:hypothetical protein
MGLRTRKEITKTNRMLVLRKVDLSRCNLKADYQRRCRDMGRGVPYGSPRSMVNGLSGARYAIYVRGESYLAACRGAEAAREFQRSDGIRSAGAYAVADHRALTPAPDGKS